MPNVRFALRKISLANRLDLMHQVRELCLRHDFLRSGDAAQQAEATLAELLVKRLFLEWGLTAIQGLTIDGKPATVDAVVRSGPEDLSQEIFDQIHQELGLTEQERKNS
jgi:hypothetical protein